MSAARLVLVGGGEHARVVAETARAATVPFELLGFVDPAPCAETADRVRLVRLGDDAALDALADAWLVLGVGGVGSPAVRRAIVQRLASRGARWAVLVHERAWVSPTAELGPGTVVMAGAVVQSGARVGAHCVVNTGAVVEHDVRLGDFAQVAPAAALGGGAHVGAGAYVGLGARVRDHVRVGVDALIGMGAVVVRDVADSARVAGVPAAPLRPQ